MQEINRAMADHMDATEMVRKITDGIERAEERVRGLNPHKPGSRKERRALERAEAKAARRAAKAA